MMVLPTVTVTGVPEVVAAKVEAVAFAVTVGLALPPVVVAVIWLPAIELADHVLSNRIVAVLGAAVAPVGSVKQIPN